ncbi:hypothetical protein FJZ53_00345 [Candidatus Woesearchaeota archaeon]|nr:hypothetical protein [Candidatus Woesearchaeota archaeon]
MKILVYGFGPYKEWKDNFSTKIVKNIRRKNLIRIVFPVELKKKVYLDKIKRFRPDIILGIGQDPRPGSNKIRIERRARNAWRYTKKENIKKISKNKPDYFVNLKLKKSKEAWLCYNASDYACNFSMYAIMEFIKTKNKNIKHAFFHIPRDYNLKKAVRFVESKIDESIKIVSLEK